MTVGIAGSGSSVPDLSGAVETALAGCLALRLMAELLTRGGVAGSLGVVSPAWPGRRRHNIGGPRRVYAVSAPYPAVALLRAAGRPDPRRLAARGGRMLTCERECHVPGAPRPGCVLQAW